MHMFRLASVLYPKLVSNRGHLSCERIPEGVTEMITDDFKPSSPYLPGHYYRKIDLESAVGPGCNDDDKNTEPFDIDRTKNAPVRRLRLWRQAGVVLNASRRFRCTLDLKREEERKQLLVKVRTHEEVIQAAGLFQTGWQVVAGPKSPKKPPPISASSGEYDISMEELSQMSRDHQISSLQQYGGVIGIAQKLDTNLEKGINGGEADLLKRKNAFGSNSYPRKKEQSFWRFLWDACQDITLIILMVAAAVLLNLGIETEGIKEGWYGGGSLELAVFIVIVVTTTSDYRQSLQFQTLNEEKQNIHLEVVRGGRRIEVSIFDIVVGDIVPLKIGDQIPADGVLVSAHSLSIDESGESILKHKDSQDPFLMSGCKVADGYGTMLVTNVGINTAWGVLLMASISEDNGEETPLQVCLNGVATFIGRVVLAVASVVFIVLVIRYFTGHTYNPDGTRQFKAGTMKLGRAIDGAIKIVTLAVTIVVVAVPEGFR